MPLGHLGLNVRDLTRAKAYYDKVMPLLGYEDFLSAEDPPPYFATFWIDPFGFMLEAVCHHDRD